MEEITEETVEQRSIDEYSNHQEPRYYWTEDFCKEIDKLVLKKLSSENYMDLRDIPEELQGLTEIENLQYDSLDILHTSLNILIVRLPQQLEETTDEVFDNDNKEAENIDTILDAVLNQLNTLQKKS
ncbi:hypothetical protein GLOIN_2v1782500 [Rhizophagus irregularis DAOM 181602=DAOM 197198]|nr:hypothetical protein GLOIN_2v1782500 [Rhizophagus irregularis DAOM 181602=DAOM 197198]